MHVIRGGGYMSLKYTSIYIYEEAEAQNGIAAKVPLPTFLSFMCRCQIHHTQCTILTTPTIFHFYLLFLSFMCQIHHTQCHIIKQSADICMAHDSTVVSWTPPRDGGSVLTNNKIDK